MYKNIKEKSIFLQKELVRLSFNEATQLASIEIQKLKNPFKVNVSSFERKQFENLSHAPNKAMNLNSYIGLIGGKFVKKHRNGKEFLIKKDYIPSDEKNIFQPRDAKYCVTLDADSILLQGYIRKLVYILERPKNKDVAVIQTPYSAFPRPNSLLEKIAGATTDIQYIIHQGFTAFNATFWVGANALIRIDALKEISEDVEERSYTVKRFVHDHTVIEDTESTIDLSTIGWRLLNHPERLAYSATPPDFGSLLIQRCRWANGGLLIFPKLFKSFFNWKKISQNPILHLGEFFIRSHYLLSIALVNIGLLILLGISFEDSVDTAWLPLTAIPYYLLYARDLSLNNYRFSDIINVYALNLVLIPINLGGVFKSIHQGLTGKQSAFARTPKVLDRTAAPWGYLLAEVLLPIIWLASSIYGIIKGHYMNSTFILAHSFLMFYGVLRFIGLKEIYEDISAGIKLSISIKEKEDLDHKRAA